MPLSGIKVLEFAGLAPGPFCGKILADFGAEVTRIDKVAENSLDALMHGKRTLAIDLKTTDGQNLVQRLAAQYDVLIDTFRPGVMEKLNLGPEKLCQINNRLIYARLTGFGQQGRLAARAGHDINYVAISGILSMLGRKDATPFPPVNILADFAGGGLMCALGICIALLERHRSGRGQVIDAAMIDGSAYAASWLLMSRQLPIWGKARGENSLDGGSYFYDTYETKDGRYMAVGALETQFFDIFKKLIDIPELSQFAAEDEQQCYRKLVRDKFLTKTQSEWTTVFEDTDACVYPVLEWTEAANHDHNKARGNYETRDDILIPRPAPLLQRTPGLVRPMKNQGSNKHAFDILKELNLTMEEIKQLVQKNVVILPTKSNL